LINRSKAQRKIFSTENCKFYLTINQNQPKFYPAKFHIFNFLIFSMYIGLDNIVAVAGGALAASSVIVAKRPDAKKILDKMVPYQGYIGILMFLYGLYSAYLVITTMGWLTAYPVRWIIFLAMTVAELGVGFILGYALISKHALSKNEAAMKKGEEIRQKLLKFQIPLGFLAIIAGVLYIFLY
jgi:hypothetical protein